MSLFSSLAQSAAKIAGETSILATSVRGLDEVAKGGNQLRKGAGILGKAAIGGYEKNRARALTTRGALLGSVAAFGFAGHGPFKGIGEEYQRGMTSMYGDNEDTRRVMNVQQFAGNALGVTLAAGGVFGLFGKGPLGFANKAEMPGTEMATVRAMENPARRQSKIGSSTRISEPWFGSTKGKSFTQILSNEDNFYLKKPMRWGMAIGATAGVGSGLANWANQPQGGFEGNIQGISSSPTGGISADLQFSTQGLMFSLHNNNKSARSRYQ